MELTIWSTSHSILPIETPYYLNPFYTPLYLQQLSDPASHVHYYVASSNLLPSPSPTSARKADPEHNTSVALNEVTPLANVAPMNQTDNLCQATPTLLNSQRHGIWWRNLYQTKQECYACATNLRLLCTNENLICRNCNINPKDSSGKALLWDCSGCEYLSCQNCLEIRPKKKPKKR